MGGQLRAALTWFFFQIGCASRFLSSQMRLVRDDNPMSCGAALGWADEAPNPYVVRGGEKGIWEARQCSNLGGRGRPSSIEFF